MAFFSSHDNASKYFGVFFSTKGKASGSGKLSIVTQRGEWVSRCLPWLAPIPVVAALLKIVSLSFFTIFPPQLAKSLTLFVNWTGGFATVAITAFACVIANYVQLHSVKSDDYFEPSAETVIRIDWVRSVSFYLIGSPELGDGYEAEPGVHSIVLILLLIAVPVFVRLVWLYRVRDSTDISWSR
jgi:hypothetical protein